MNDYAEQRYRYLADPEKFWMDRVEQFHWFRKWDKVNNYASDCADMRWFINGQINICYEVLDRKVLNGHGNDVVLIHDSPFNKTVSKYTYNDILDKVSRLAGALASEFDVQQGDRVTIYLPMLAETTIAILAAARIGAVYSVMETVHPAWAMVNRLHDFKPKVIITTDCEFDANGTRFNPKEYLNSVQEMRGVTTRCLVLRRPWPQPSPEPITANDKHNSEYLDWEEAIENARPVQALPVEINAPVAVIYTSGTTGTPKGLVISARYFAANLSIYRNRDSSRDVGQSDDRSTTATKSIAESGLMYSGSVFVWLVGQMRGCFSSLYTRQPFLLWEKPIADSDMHEFYRLMIKYGITKAFIPTSYIRALKKQDSNGAVARSYRPKLKISSMIVGAVPGDLSTFAWIRQNWGINFFQLYGLTETGILTVGDLSDGRKYEDQPPLSSGKAAPGVSFKILRADSSEADVNEVGRITLRLPTPAITSGFLNDEQNEKFNGDYLKAFPGYFDTHDEGMIDAEGYIHVTNRIDTVYKIGGHRMSCDAIEQVLNTHPEVAECVVVTRLLPDATKRPVALFVLTDDSSGPVERVIEDMKRIVGEQLGDWVKLDSIRNVRDLPRNKSGKVARDIVMEEVKKMTEELESKSNV